MSQRTCSGEECSELIGPRSKGLCKRCRRRDYYHRNGERERAGNAAWRADHVEHERERWTAYAEKRWGAEQEARREDLKARLAAEEKECTSCRADKPKTEFYADSRRRDGLYSWCKSCFQEHMAARDDREQRQRRQRERWADDPEYRQRCTERARRWRTTRYANDEAFAQDIRDRARRWAAENPERASINARTSANRRRSRLRDQGGEPVDYAAILARDGMTCHLCKVEIGSLDDLHFDHVVPLARGGAHSEDNIRPAHALCNMRKGSRLT